MGSKRGNIGILLAVLITALLTSITTFLLVRTYNPTKEKLVQPQVRNTNNCRFNGETSADQFLDDYIVKPGDSLIHIATKQLGDPSRVNELALLNLTRYPGFYGGTPGVPNLTSFLEVGWVLKVPPEWMPRTSGNLTTLNGKIIGGVAGYNFGISSTSGEDGRYSFFNLDKDATNEKGTVFKIGDCATILRDNMTNKAVKIDLQ